MPSREIVPRHGDKAFDRVLDLVGSSESAIVARYQELENEKTGCQKKVKKYCPLINATNIKNDHLLSCFGHFHVPFFFSFFSFLSSTAYKTMQHEAQLFFVFFYVFIAVFGNAV